MFFFSFLAWNRAFKSFVDETWHAIRWIEFVEFRLMKAKNAPNHTNHRCWCWVRIHCLWSLDVRICDIAFHNTHTTDTPHSTLSPIRMHTQRHDIANKMYIPKQLWTEKMVCWSFPFVLFGFFFGKTNNFRCDRKLTSAHPFDSLFLSSLYLFRLKMFNKCVCAL